ncbi:16S rRNA (guanine(966)-N(2))-methyltransferase RsmD [bacterium]|nr:16S rRNA (guanine(966)-N(2))-methyltransferase RsmD [bacterium]
MRIIAGSAGSRALTAPKGVTIRPTADRVREALFASLADRTIDCRFGDLYAGSGSVGLEALSRGAAWCVFVERDPRCLHAVRANLAATGLSDRAEVIRGDVLTQIEPAWERGPLDVVFMDPPYRESAEPLLRLVLRLARDARHDCLAVVECERGMEPALAPTKEKCYGRTKLLYYEAADCPP